MAYRHIAICTLVALAAAHTSTAGAATPEADFAARCATPGVLKCIGFDTQADMLATGEVRDVSTGEAVVNPQAYPDNVNAAGWRYPAVDTSVSASGGGSLRLTANPIAAANHSGGFYYGEQGPVDWPQTFGAGTDFWIQYRVLYDAEMANNANWKAAGGDGNKNIIVFRSGKSCNDLEVTVQDVYAAGYLRTYTNCGGQNTYQCPVGVAGSSCASWNTGVYAQYAQGRPFDNHMYAYGPELKDFWCVRDRESDAACPYFSGRSGVWHTWMLHITVKGNGVVGSKIESWVSRGNGEPMRKSTDFTFPWSYEAGGAFSNIMLTLYHTGKRSGAHPVANAWYDEFILSTQPIPAPGAVAPGPQDTVPPAPPSGLFVQ